jgi:RNA polymerase sigma-70 factor, ECF subfamily
VDDTRRSDSGLPESRTFPRRKAMTTAPKRSAHPTDRPFLMKHEANASLDLAPILEAAARGSGAAWEQVVSLYARRVFALAQSRCRNHDVAEEITQSVLATLAAKLGGGEYQEQGRFESWLFRMAMNRVRDHVRREKRRPVELEVLDQDGTGPEIRERTQQASIDTAELDRLRMAMERLSEADREIVELRHHGQMNFKDMADLLDEPMGTLLARHHRALRKLKELMEAETEDRAAGAGREAQA